MTIGADLAGVGDAEGAVHEHLHLLTEVAPHLRRMRSHVSPNILVYEDQLVYEEKLVYDGGFSSYTSIRGDV